MAVVVYFQGPESTSVEDFTVNSYSGSPSATILPAWCENVDSLNDSLSNTTSGVPQGYIHRPMLFR